MEVGLEEEDDVDKGIKWKKIVMRYAWLIKHY